MLRAAIRIAALFTALWCGVVAAIAALVAPALFALLPSATAGAVANRLFEHEAYGSVAVGLIVLVVERARTRDARLRRRGSAFSVEFGLALGVLFCAVAGYFAVQPMMEAARAGQGRLSFGALHGISASFFVLKGVLLAVLAWRSMPPAAPLSVKPIATTS